MEISTVVFDRVLAVMTWVCKLIENCRNTVFEDGVVSAVKITVKQSDNRTVVHTATESESSHGKIVETVRQEY